jgi:hypothetical protein
MRKQSIATLLCILSLAGCSKSDNAAQVPPAGAADGFDTDQFLQFLNPQYELAAGDYSVVAATRNSDKTGPFELRIQSDDGSLQTVSSRWDGSGGMSATAAGNPRVLVSLDKPGGITVTLRSTAAVPVLYLLDAAERVVGEDANLSDDPQAIIDLTASRTNNPQYAVAYYESIDPNGTRRDLSAWKQSNGFDQGNDAHLVFRDTTDVGYGRDMYLRRNGNCIAAYVNNFQVTAIAGQEYSELNLDAAVANDRRWHRGTNAIEWAPAAN